MKTEYIKINHNINKNCNSISVILNMAKWGESLISRPLSVIEINKILKNHGNFYIEYTLRNCLVKNYNNKL